MLGMKEMLIKSQFPNSEIELANTSRKERAEINKTVPPLLERLGRVIREHIPSLDLIKGNNVKLNPRFSQPSDQVEHSIPVDDIVLTRRNFLKLTAGIALWLTVGQSGIKPANAQEIEKRPSLPEHNQKKSLGEKTTQFLQEEIKRDFQEVKFIRSDDYGKTALQQILLMGSKKVVNVILDELKIKPTELSNKQADEILGSLKNRPVEGIIKYGILGPAIEEYAYRLFPSVDFIDKNDKSIRWDVGIPSAAIFALVHNIKGDEFNHLKLRKSVPLTHFIGGLFYWYLMREKGFSHAVLAHSMNNSIPLSIGALSYKAYPEEKNESNNLQVKK